MFQVATGRDPLIFVCAHRRRSVAVEVVRPLLFLLPSHVAGVLAGSLGEATGVSLCLPGRLFVADVAAHLLLGRVVSLRLGSGGGVRIDLAVVPVRLLP